jgi:virginiamycin B lyase
VVAGFFLAVACSSSSDDNASSTVTSAATTRPGAEGAPATTTAPAPAPDGELTVRTFPVPAGSHPHDVAPAADGTVWYTAQATGELGNLDPVTGAVREISLGDGSAPHGVIVGLDGGAWVTDSGLNAIVRVAGAGGGPDAVQRFPLPPDTPNVNLNTAVFGRDGILWFTGQAGYYGRLDPGTGRMEVFKAPEGRGPYGITVTPGGDVYYASLAGNHIARVDPATGQATVIGPPTEGQGARRVWSDSAGRIWVSEWNAGQVAVFDPASGGWEERKLPGDDPQAYAVYVDDRDKVWLTDFGANSIVVFDPALGSFRSVELPDPGAEVRQLLGRPGQVWGAESGADRLVVVEGA